MSRVRCTILFAANMSAAAAVSLGAQAVERAVFLVRLGRDTVAGENASYSGGRAESALRLRNPLVRIQRVLTLSPGAETRTMETTIGAGASGDSARTHSVLTISGDSGTVATDATAAGAPPQTHRIVGPRGAVPFVNLSGQTLELVLRRARAMGGDRVFVPLLLGGGQSLPVRVTWVGADSVVLTVGGADIRARTDRDGRFLGATIPSQGALFDRLPADSPVAAWMPVRANYDAPAGAPYRAEQMTLRTPAGITAAGTLTMPAHAAGARVPAVVLITGSGPQDRDEAIPSLGNYRPFREIADTLSRRGIAVLRLDDRGIGGTDAGPATATSADYADDIRAAVAWLRARADVDPSRVGLVGHSEGGIIAPMLAATDTNLRAIVLVAGTAKTGRAISAYQRRSAIEHDAAIAPAMRDSAMAMSDRAVETLFAAPGWFHFFAGYDPLPTARQVRMPALILQGETDRQVTSEQADALAGAMRAGGNRQVTLRTFPRMNHLLLEDTSGDPGGYRTLSSYAVRRDFLGVLADWLARTL